MTILLSVSATMPVSNSYRDYVLEQLAIAGSVTAKKMFGGVGLYLDGLFFALIADDRLYFKVDDTNRSDYETVGMGPFQPYADIGGKPYTMQYYEVPVEILEDGVDLCIWAKKALAVATHRSVTAAKPPKKARKIKSR